MNDPEARAQRRRQQPGPGGRADEREFLQWHLHRPRARALPDHDVELVVLEGGIQDLLDRRRHPVDFVDEEDFVLREVGEDRCQIAGLLEDWTGRGPDRRTELVPDHVGKSSLSKTRRAVEEYVVECLRTLSRGRNRHLQVLANAILADVIIEYARPKAGF